MELLRKRHVTGVIPQMRPAGIVPKSDGCDTIAAYSECVAPKCNCQCRSV